MSNLDDNAVTDNKEFALTDTGNAERFVYRFGDKVRYQTPNGPWLFYDGTRWRENDRKQIESSAAETIRSIYKEASEIEDKEHRTATAAWAKKSESARSLRSLLSLAQHQPGIPVTPDEFDQDVNLLNLLNGTLNLDTYQLQQNEPTDLIRKLAPVAWDPDAVCSLWEEFLEQILPDPDVCRYFAKSLGYTLTGDISERVIFFAYGARTATGKTTTLGTIEKLMGDYAVSISAKSFVRKREDTYNTPGLARLPGRRFILVSELSDGSAFDTQILKSFAGRDRIEVKALYQSPIEFLPQGTIWMMGNQRPSLPSEDEAIWDRLRVIPFDISTPTDERDLTLDDKLRTPEALSGILNWIIGGLQLYREEGLQPPEGVVAAIEDYRTDVDLVGDFLQDRCVTGPELRVAKKYLYSTYQEWAKQCGYRALSHRRFSRILDAKGFQSKKSGAVRSWVGIELSKSPSWADGNNASEDPEIAEVSDDDL